MREICLDIETTGLEPKNGDKIVEIACVELFNKTKTGKFFHSYINPRRDVPEEAFRIHGLSTDFLKDKPFFDHIADKFLSFIGNDPVIIHNASFDTKFLNHELKNLNRPILDMSKIIDSLILARKKFPGSPCSLDALCKRFAIDLGKRKKHGALIDTELLCDVYIELMGGAQTGFSFDQQVGNDSNNFNQTIDQKNNFSSNSKFISNQNHPATNQNLNGNLTNLSNHQSFSNSENHNSKNHLNSSLDSSTNSFDPQFSTNTLNPQALTHSFNLQAPSNHHQTNFPLRTFTLTDAELQQHQDFILKNFKNNLWNY